MSRTQNPAPAKTNAANQTWEEHEHVAALLELEAKKLVAAAGSPEMAKQAIDAVKTTSGSSQQEEDLALALGFSSYRALVEASGRGARIANLQWFVTPIRHDEWVLWNDSDLEILGVFDSQEAAMTAAG